MQLGECATAPSLSAMRTDSATLPPAGSLLAFDFGTRRIGVAVGDLGLRLAHPLTTITGERNDIRFAAIAALIDEWQPVALVVGMPVGTDDAEHEMTARCRRFANQLKARYRLQIHLVDERYTSVEAEASVRSSSARGRSNDKSRIDALAAQCILQDFLDRSTGLAAKS